MAIYIDVPYPSRLRYW